jgi:CelD/BcsL family acetyltransferase involved in cellulose biosynthesis
VVSMDKGEQNIEVQLILKPDDILEIESAWNDLVGQSCENPFMLSSFVSQVIRQNWSEDNAPLILVFSYKKKIIGVAPFMTKKTFGVRSLEFVNKAAVSPDLIINSQYREICIAQMFDFLFKKLNCKFVDLPLPFESPNMQIIKEQCKVKGIGFSVSPEMGHLVLPIACSWTEFESARGKNFRHRFRKVKRKLDEAGTWNVLCLDDSQAKVAVEKIFDVEKRSWKQTWRIQKGDDVDDDLITFLEAARHAEAIEPAFDWKVWFLEIANRTAAYQLVLEYKNVAYLTKTSYDQRYETFSPGMYLINTVICDLFNENQVKAIDFLTDLPFVRTWTSVCKQRYKVTMTKGIIPTLAESITANGFLPKNQRLLSNSAFFLRRLTHARTMYTSLQK